MGPSDVEQMRYRHNELGERPPPFDFDYSEDNYEKRVTYNENTGKNKEDLTWKDLEMITNEIDRLSELVS